MGKNRKLRGRNVRHELEDNESYAALSDVPSIEMEDGEVISPREWKRRFDKEYYNANRYGNYKMIDTLEGQKEAKRNMNSGNRDAINLHQKVKGEYYKIKEGDTLNNIANKHNVTVSYLCSINNFTEDIILIPGDKILVNQVEYEIELMSTTEDQFMQEASDAWEWENVYKEQGYGSALETVLNQAVRDIEDGLDIRVTLSRFIIKAFKLKTLKEKDRVNGRTRKKKT